jgi:hypothetical protein
MDISQNNTPSLFDTRMIVFYSFCSVLLCTVILIFLVPLWNGLDLHAPNDKNHKVDFTEPVDSAFYVRNAELNNIWVKDNPASLWFHPLVSWIIKLLPKFIPANYRLWIISLLSAFFSIILLYKYISIISPINLNPALLLLVPFLPGGLNISTGNAELPCLLFTLALLLSVIRKWHFFFPIFFGSLAVLTKPNALYMIPALAIYGIYSIRNNERKVLINSTLGIISIVITMVLWAYYVDLKMGGVGSYWQARQAFISPLSNGQWTFLQSTARIMVFSHDNGLKLKFLTAIVIPIVDMWILLGIPLRDESHRVAILFSLLAMFLLMLFTNNPNKIIVYATTVPGHFATGILFVKQTLSDSWITGKLERPAEKMIRRLAGYFYIFFCLLMGIFFIFGTPLAWYY